MEIKESMKLKEIEMDLPYVKNEKNIYQIQKSLNLDYKEAVRKDYETNWKEMRKSFRMMTRCMTAMIERIMLPINTTDCWKIIFECVGGCAIPKYKNLLGAYVVQVPFELDEFFQLSDYDKKKIIICKITEGLDKISNDIPFETSNIYKACKEVMNAGYNNEWKWGKKVAVKDRFVQVAIRHDITNLGIYMVFTDKNNLFLKKALLVNTTPDERIYNKYLGRIEKVSENEVALVAKNGEKFIQICDC